MLDDESVKPGVIVALAVQPGESPSSRWPLARPHTKARYAILAFHRWKGSPMAAIIKARLPA